MPASHGQWDLGERGLARVIRASVHVYNDASDLDAVEAVLRRPARPGTASPAGDTTAAEMPYVPGTIPQKATSRRVEHTADVVVIGAGIHGRSAAWSLARRGISVLQIEQFGGGHVEGSSHGATRMIRRATPTRSGTVSSTPRTRPGRN